MKKKITSLGKKTLGQSQMTCMIYIRRPLPELERARLQLQPSNTILQTAGDSLLCTILKGQH